MESDEVKIARLEGELDKLSMKNDELENMISDLQKEIKVLREVHVKLEINGRVFKEF